MADKKAQMEALFGSDSEVGALLEKAARRKNSSNNNDGGGGVRMVRQGFLTHLETQGEVLEGFVLMALEVASVAALTRLVQAYNAEMAPHHDRTLAALLTLGRRCHAATTDARLLAAIGDDPNVMIEVVRQAHSPEPDCARTPSRSPTQGQGADHGTTHSVVVRTRAHIL